MTEISKYELIQKVAETQSIGRAAEYYQYTQSAVSQAIKNMEKEFGVTLFNRTTQGVFLSHEGKRLMPYIRKIIRDDYDLREEISSMQTAQEGIVHLGAYVSVTCHFLPGCITEFHKVYPNIRLELFQEDDLTLIDRLRRGYLDLLFFSDPKKREFSFQNLFEDPFMAIVPENHYLAQKDHISITDLIDEPLILLDLAYSDYLKEMFHTANINPSVRVRYNMIDEVAMIAMVEAGHGIAVLPYLTVYRNPYRVKVIPIEPSCYRTLGIAVRKNDYPSWAVKKFIKFVEEYAKTFSVWDNM